MLFVTPLAGVWIEMGKFSSVYGHDAVTPLAGVWIEIADDSKTAQRDHVTPLAGVWIEISSLSSSSSFAACHSPRGSVD